MPLPQTAGSPKKLLAKALRCHGAGQVAEAIDLLRQVVKAAPRNLDGNFFLGTFLAETGDLPEGRRYLAAARDLDPRSLQILNNLGNVLRMLGEMEEALRCYQRATAIDPSFVHGWVNLGFISAKLERWTETVASFDRVGGEHCDDTDILGTLAKACLKLSQTERAARIYEKLFALDPADRHGAAIALASLRGGPLPERHSDGMVVDLYRQKAAAWDQDVLRPGDSYFGPEHMARLLESRLKADASLDILDLGCGTGNCGPFLAPAARRLVGVDLSPDMLREAEKKGLYGELVEKEIGDYLAGNGESFDAIVGAGVFIMFSGLEKIFGQVAGRLKPGGLFALTLYRSSGPDIEIRPNNHFGHSRGYLERVAAQAGLEPVEVREVIHETAEGQEQPGFAVLLRKP
ncbi:MAG: tetratricopeptide repeat protein [Actinomycetota bacterium]